MPIKSLLNESKLLIFLTIPLFVSAFAEAFIGFTSTAFLAHLGPRELAAGALAYWLFMTLMMIMWGVLIAVSVLVARYYGAQNHVAITRVVRDGFVLSVILLIPALLCLGFAAPILLLLGQHKPTVQLTQIYLHSIMGSIFPDFIMLVLLQMVIGLGRPRINMIFTLIWVPLTILCNYILVFGKFHFPALGIAGIGWGNTIVSWFMGIIFLAYLATNKNYRQYFQFKAARHYPSQIGELVKVGLPMGIMYCLEIAFFLALTLLMGKISYEALAANQITLQYLWQVLVLSGCLAQAVTVRLGHKIGAKDTSNYQQTAMAGVYVAIVIVLGVDIIFWFFPEMIIGVDLNIHNLNNQAVIHLAKQFLALAAIFQLVEAVRFTTFGALRAFKDTRFTLYNSIFTFWGIALTVGYILAFYFKLQGQGLWWGLIIGELCGAIILQLRLRYKMQQL